MKFKILFLSAIFLLQLQAASSAPPVTGKADLDGDGKMETITIASKDAPDGTSAIVTATVNGQSLRLKGLDPESSDDALEAKAVSPYGDKREWLQVAVNGSSDFMQYSYLTYSSGTLRECARLDGQGEVSFPGNGSAIQKVWMGFWTRTLKFEVEAGDKLHLLPAEMYHVGIKAKVLKSFELKLSRTGPAVLARPRVGSQVEVLVFHRNESVQNGEDDEINDWYLIKSETGLTGWVQMRTLRDGEALELPWAG